MLDRGRLLAHRSVDGKHPAAERGRAPRDFAADVAEPDDADRADLHAAILSGDHSRLATLDR